MKRHLAFVLACGGSAAGRTRHPGCRIRALTRNQTREARRGRRCPEEVRARSRRSCAKTSRRSGCPGRSCSSAIGNRIVYQKAIGDRALLPSREPMTLDTIFDLASLTKPVATTTSVMLLIEQGSLRLIDRVSTFIPGSNAMARRTSPFAIC